LCHIDHVDKLAFSEQGMDLVDDAHVQLDVVCVSDLWKLQLHATTALSEVVVNYVADNLRFIYGLRGLQIGCISNQTVASSGLI
jgi:hypothetical protein